MSTTRAEGAAPARLAAIEGKVALARKALASGDATGAAWRARAAAEAMLLLLAELHGVELPRGPSSPATLETLRKALRHGRALERKVEDHIDYIQRVGNRAAHAQAHPDDAVDLEEARNVVAALEHVLRAVRSRMPTPEGGYRRAPRGGWAGLILAAACVVAAPFVGFRVTTRALGMMQPPTASPTPSAPSEADRLVDPTLLDALLDEEALPTDDAGGVLKAVREGLPPDDLALAHLDCATLLRAHDSVWARHGLRFGDPETRAAHPSGTLDLHTVTPRLSAVDRTTSARLRALLGARGCACPTPEGPCRP